MVFNKMKKKNLTIKQLKQIEPHTIFAKGETLIEHPWFNNDAPNKVNGKGEPDKNGKFVKVRWVAIRGGIHDWAIYHSLDANLEPSRYLGGFSHLEVDWNRIADHGAKIHREDDIKRLVPCDNNALGMYRH